MTISSIAASQLIAGDGITTTFSFGFIADEATDFTLTSIASNGAMSIISPSQYTLLINPPNPNQLWGVGGNIIYPISGVAIPAGTYLLAQRTLPFTQETSVRNQGNYFAQVTEQALDLLCMQIQQVAARTGQMRGTWATGIAYNFGDVVVDGINGNSTGNYYMCAVANTSGVWATDLAASDWSLAINIQAINAVIGAYLPLTGGTLNGGLTITGTLNASGGFTAHTVPNSALAQMAANTVKVNNTSGLSNAADLALSASTILGRGASGNIAALTASSPISIGASAIGFNAQQLANSLISDVSLATLGVYFTGPTVAQGTSGVWYASGTVSVLDAAGAAAFRAKLWDGTTVIDSCVSNTSGTSARSMLSLSGAISSPVGNLRISVLDNSTNTGKILFNDSGNSKDSTLTAFRIG